MSEINDKLRKIRELAIKGSTDEERDSARSLLDKLLKKYEVDESEILDEEVKLRKFYYHGKEELQILMQVSFKVTNNPTCWSHYNKLTGRKIKTAVSIECTQSQQVEINFLFDFYKRLWEKEKSFLMIAFISKHDLAGSNEEAESRSLSLDEYLKVKDMMKGLSSDTPLVGIEEGVK